MTPPTPTPRLRVRCRSCGRTVLSGVERIADDEAAELRAHLATCRPDLPAADRDAANVDLAVLLARFEVASTGNGA